MFRIVNLDQSDEPALSLHQLVCRVGPPLHLHRPRGVGPHEVAGLKVDQIRFSGYDLIGRNFGMLEMLTRTDNNKC